MPRIERIIRVEIDPSKPITELAQVIDAVISVQPQKEVEILQGLAVMINAGLAKLKGAEKDGKSIRKPRRNEKNQG